MRRQTCCTIGGQNQLDQIVINDGRPRTVQFRNDFMGQGIRRDETDNITTAGDPHELWYRFSGREMIYVGNNGTVDTDEATSITNRTASQGTGAFFNGASSGTSFADSDLAYDSIDSYDQGSTGGMYTVRDGDTLASIASSLWGDSSLWYKIAELNGLTADSALPTGMPLLIPVGVVRSTNNATTYKPYDPAEVVGNTMPTAVKPPKSKHNCGVLGQIVMVVIAAVVAIYTAGAAAQFFAGAMNLNAAAITAAGEIATGTAAAGTVTGASLATLGAAGAGAAVGGAVGSVVSQVVGVATGIQDKFSWNAVGLAAIGAAAGVGTAKVIPGTSNFAAAERGMANSAITQGIGVATGMQKKFSWAAVAAAGIGSAAGNEFRHDFGSGIADALGARSTDAVVAKSAQYATSGIVAMVDAIASAATRTLIEGTDFGDNVLAALPDAIGSTIGNALARGLTGSQSVATAPADDAAETGSGLDLNMAPIDFQAILNPAASGLIAPALATRTLAKGDSFWKLAAADLGPHASSAAIEARVMQYMEANRGVDPRAMRVGDPVNVPDSSIVGGVDITAAYAQSNTEYQEYLNARSWSDLTANAGEPSRYILRPELTDAANLTAFAGRADTYSFTPSWGASGGWTPGSTSVQPSIAASEEIGGLTWGRLWATVGTEEAVGGGPEDPAADLVAAGTLLIGASIILSQSRPDIWTMARPRTRDQMLCSNLGVWQRDNSYMSDRSYAYQAQITGAPGHEFVVDGVRFDGCRDTSAGPLLLSAKATYGRAGNLGQNWHVNGNAAVVRQGQAQQVVALSHDVRLEWHFANSNDMAGAIRLWNEATPRVALNVVNPTYTPQRP
ncbi:MAG: LysM peptidoglycan-binding domain-containing protein [Terricaulis sp.]